MGGGLINEKFNQMFVLDKIINEEKLWLKVTMTLKKDFSLVNEASG